MNKCRASRCMWRSEIKSMYHRGIASEDIHVYTNRHMMQLCISASANTSCTDAFLFTWRLAGLEAGGRPRQLLPHLQPPLHIPHL